MQDNKNIVLPTRWVAEVLQRRTMLISSLLGAEPITLDAAIRMVGIALNEILQQRQLWRAPGIFHYGEITEGSGVEWPRDAVTSIRLPELTGDNEVYTVSETFSCFVLNCLINEIEKNLLNPHYPERSFDLLEVGMLDNGDSVLINHGDYRIWRFEQLRREGKATY